MSHPQCCWAVTRQVLIHIVRRVWGPRAPRPEMKCQRTSPGCSRGSTPSHVSACLERTPRGCRGMLLANLAAYGDQTNCHQNAPRAPHEVGDETRLHEAHRDTAIEEGAPRRVQREA